MKKLKFKPEDFKDCVEGIHELSSMFDSGNIDEYKCAKLANAMFEKWYREEIENAPLVYAEPVYVNKVPVNFTRRHKPEHSAYTAKLVCIEEIK